MDLPKRLTQRRLRDPHFPVYSNVTAEPVTTRRERQGAAAATSSPARCGGRDEIQAIARQHPNALYVEMGPGTVLVGLVKKIAPSLKTATCGTAAEVDAAHRARRLA